MADLGQTPANVVKVSGTSESFMLGGTVTAGMPVKLVTGTLTACSDDSAPNAAAYGIALNGGAIGQPCAVQRDGVINLGAVLSVGKVYLVSTAGAICPVDDIASGEFITILGVALTADNLKLVITASGVAAAAAVS
jgi:hypothetical protein